MTILSRMHTTEDYFATPAILDALDALDHAMSQNETREILNAIKNARTLIDGTSLQSRSHLLELLSEKIATIKPSKNTSATLDAA